MKVILSAFLSLVVLTACNYRSDRNYWSTVDISSYKPDNCTCKLYAEIYKGGLIDLKYEYLTDSANFRVYIDKYDDESEAISYHCKGDTIFAVKRQDTGVLYDDISGKHSTIYKEVSTQKLSLQELKKRHDF